MPERIKRNDTAASNIREVADLVIKDFKLSKNRDEFLSIGLKEFREKLQKTIAYLLDSDFERFLNAMYRLDIDEQKFRLTLSGHDNQNIAWEITDLIIERELQKVITRRKFREGLV